MKDYQERCKALERCIGDFLKVPDMNDKLAVAEKAVRNHAYLHHYTSVTNALRMLQGQCMYLTRSDSVSLDDNQEHRKYGSKEMSERTFLACFDSLDGESAAMWGLYCDPNRYAVRLAIPCDVIAEWIDGIKKKGVVEIAEMLRNHKKPENASLQIEDALLTDLLYADVRGDSLGEKSRKNSLSLHGATITVPGFQNERTNPAFTGRVKDREWRFEEESRFLIRVSGNCRNVKKIKIPLSKDWIRDVSFTLSPWSDETDKDELTKILQDAVARNVDKERSKVGVYKSNLSSALKRWEMDHRKQTRKAKCSRIVLSCEGGM